MSTDEEWEKWGAIDPYFGVLTRDQFRRQNLSDARRSEFFDTGKTHVDHVLDVCRSQLDSSFTPKRILDFGCGVGRLILAFAQRSEEVVGLDVSTSMLREARKNCDDRFLKNVELLNSDDELTSLEGTFDLVHSVIVFQHIPVERGRRILRRLLSHIRAGGIGVIHVTYWIGTPPDLKGRLRGRLRAIPWIRIPVSRLKWGLLALWRIVSRHASDSASSSALRPDPEMQMNAYSLAELIGEVQSLGAKRLFLELTNHGGPLGAIVYFQIPKTKDA